MNEQKRKDFDKFRMAQWLLLSVAAYWLASLLAGIATPHPVDAPDPGLFPRIQAILWKCGHLNIAAYLGYWFSRTRLGRLTPSSTAHDKLAHAIVIGATMLAFGMAL